MRIGIDARLYGVGDRGLGRYTEKLITYLEKTDTQNEYFIFLRRDGYKNYQPQNKNFHKVLADCRPYSIKEQLTFSCQLKKYKLELVHFTHFNVPIFYRQPFIVTVHDLIITKFPESRRKSTRLPLPIYYLKLFLYNFVLRNALQKAKKIIAVSEATKKDIIDFYQVDFSKIKVIYEGVDVIKNYDSQSPIYDPYALYVGAAYPHKNLERLIIGFQKFISNSEAPLAKKLKLVLVGKNDYFYQRLKKLVEKLGLIDEIIFSGEVDDQQLSSYYQHALFFIFPSLAEGFGLPALEALNYNLPVAASSLSSLPEILGSAAHYFDPRDTKEIAETFKIMALDDKLRNELKEACQQQAKKFSWRLMAEEITKVYLSL